MGKPTGKDNGANDKPEKPAADGSISIDGFASKQLDASLEQNPTIKEAVMLTDRLKTMGIKTEVDTNSPGLKGAQEEAVSHAKAVYAAAKYVDGIPGHIRNQGNWNEKSAGTAGYPSDDILSPYEQQKVKETLAVQGIALYETKDAPFPTNPGETKASAGAQLAENGKQQQGPQPPPTASR